MSLHFPRDITGQFPGVGIAELCAFGNPVFTAAGTVEPDGNAFVIHWASEGRKPERVAKAETAVRRLQKETSRLSAKPC